MRFAISLLGLLAIPVASAAVVPQGGHGLVSRDDGSGIPSGLDYWKNDHCDDSQRAECYKEGKRCSKSE